MTLNGIEGIKGIQWNIKWKESKGFVICQWSINGIQWNSMESHQEWKESI